MHGLRCDACNAIQIGDNMITYRCMRCYDYDLCETCYKNTTSQSIINGIRRPSSHKDKEDTHHHAHAYVKMTAADNSRRVKEQSAHLDRYLLAGFFGGFIVGSSLVWFFKK